MLFSWNLLTDSLRLAIPHEELADRLSLVGFNHESTREVGGDLCLDLEITSNRPDTLCHRGIAREIGLLLGQSPRLAEPPAPRPAPGATPAVRVENRVPDLCSRFEAVPIHGVKVGPSPWWLAKRIETLGFRPINNVVDVTNYVMSESGQPTHAYDLAKLGGGALVIRHANAGEEFLALNHQTYKLDPKMVVIADAERPVGLAGVIGGLDSEISAGTTDLVVEVARFDPLTVRRASRALGLQSQASYRFERPIDPEMVRWARDRCVELILATAGGTVGVPTRYDAPPAPERPTVTLRVAQVARILGIEVPRDEMRRILIALGLEPVGEDADSMTFRPPSWRSDLDREIDLVEEVGRIHDYANIPEDRPVRLGAIGQDRRGRVEGEVRSMLAGVGFSEAVTYSFVSRDLVGGEFLPEPVEPIRVEHATRRQSNLMRLSLVPSLLEAVSYNEAHGNFGVRLYEIAHTYRPVAGRDLPDESSRLAVACPGDFFAAKGLLEGILARIHARADLRWEPRDFAPLRPGHSAAIHFGDRPFGFVGEVAPTTIAKLKLRGTYSVLEVSMDLIEGLAVAIPQHEPTPIFPGVQRDLSLVVPVKTTWGEVEGAVRNVVDATFEGVTFLDSFRGGNLPPDRQSLHFNLRFRNPERTMTGDEVDAQVARIVDHCRATLGATVRS